MFQGAWNIINGAEPLLHAQEGLIKQGDVLMQEYEDSFSSAGVALPIAFGIFFLIIQGAALHLFYRDIGYTLTVMRHVSPATVEASFLPISRGVRDEKVNVGASKLARASNLGYAILPVVIIGLLVIDCVGFALGFELAMDSLAETETVLSWYLLSAQRMEAVPFITGMAHMLYVGAEGMMLSIRSFTDYPRYVYHWGVMEYLYLLYEAGRYDLLAGSETVKSMIGFDDEMDRMQISEICSTDPSNFYEFSRCLSMDRSCSLVGNFLGHIVAYWPDKLGELVTTYLEGHDYVNLLCLYVTSLNDQLHNFSDRLMEFCRDTLTSVGTILLIAMVIVIVVNFVVLFALVSLFVGFDHGIESIRQLVRLLPPKDILENSRLVAIITGLTSNDSLKLVASEIIVREAPDGIITVSTDYTIDTLNHAFYEITGLTADEVLGHGLSVLFPAPTPDSPADSPSIVLYDKLEQLKRGSLKDEQRLEFRAPEEFAVQVHVSLLVIPHYSADNSVKKFTFILHDLSQQAATEAEARSLRDRCELIMEKSVPIEVYQAMRGTSTKRPSFVTNVGTVLRIEFDGLRDTVSTMSPSQVMDALTGVFEAFDDIIAKYPAVHSIRTNEEAIVACCGLFDYSTEIRDQAEQAASACMEFRDMKEDLNDRLVLDLQYRLSIVQGGPIMGGPLDNTTPNFDLLGEVVKIGEMLCRNTAPGTIRINSELQGALDPVTFATQKTPKGPKDLMDTIVLQGSRE
jgi:PAS domain S-box-containing protein